MLKNYDLVFLMSSEQNFQLSFGNALQFNILLLDIFCLGK